MGSCTVFYSLKIYNNFKEELINLVEPNFHDYFNREELFAVDYSQFRMQLLSIFSKYRRLCSKKYGIVNNPKYRSFIELIFKENLCCQDFFDSFRKMEQQLIKYLFLLERTENEQTN